MNNDKPIFTQAMADVGELPPIGSEYMTSRGKHKAIAHAHQVDVDVVVGQSQLCVTISELSEVKPIDTRTDEEKKLDKIYLRVGAETERDKEIVRDTLKAKEEKPTSCSYEHADLEWTPICTISPHEHLLK